MDTGICKTCEAVKPATDFYRNPLGVPGLRRDCKDCHNAKRRQEYAAGRSGRGRDVSYEQLLKREYGITLAQYNAMVRKQAGRCAICRRPESVKMKRTGQLRRLAVDHDHVTGAVRGLLCQRCNVLVWAIEDNHTTLAAIGAYIEAFRETFANGVPL